MKPFSTVGKVGLVLLLLNEIRGIVVVLSILGAWAHAGKSGAPADPVGPCASAPQPALSAACRGARATAKPKPAATAPAQPSGRRGAIIRPQ